MFTGLARTAVTSVAALALVAGGSTSAVAGKPTPKPKPQQAVACQQETNKLTLLAFNDFHGRLATASPDTVAFFGTIEAARQAAGEQHSMVISSGDNVGASLFPSAVQEDNPTIDLLNAMDLDSATAGNHEFDRGWADFTGRIQQRAEFPYLAANLYTKGTTTPAVKPYTIVERDGLRIAVVGAVTGDLKSLVGTEVFTNVDLGDPVAAVNTQTEALTDGDPANGEADVVIASYHEGAAVSEPKTLDEALTSKPFASIVNETSPKVAAILTAHTHQSYAWQAPVPGTDKTRPVIESGSYGAAVGQVELTLDNTQPMRPGNNKGKGKGAVKDPGAELRGTVCSSQAQNLKVKPSTEVPALVAAHPRVAEVQKITTDALAQAKIIGSRVIATSTGPVTRGLKADGSPDNRAVESSLSNMVAQMFHDKLGNGDPEFIGVQNPGGTRADLPSGEISYAAAAAILPFANTLMTTQLTGAQVKTMLEQQWQTNADGSTPSRAYLQLGLSKNVTYTYDESRPAGDRITSIAVNGKAIDPAKLYTVGSGNFLITGGDNFRVLAEGQNTRDTGASDLAAWVDWLTEQQTVSPSYARGAVSMKETPKTLTAGQATTFTVGAPQGANQTDTLDMKSAGAVANTSLVASIGDVQVGTARVVNGQATITVTVPASATKGSAVLTLKAAPSGTVVSIPVTIA
ncbi:MULTISPECIES: bifunctional metallophosphatase/5'-nucleotidase [unclassified Luteococcus]|uniref:bifunctional metallophosphatase/5'-nucleotidase n=1 Tax=unclassified Luteococcus TaxID=2639923 RepID=UPI00313F3183